MHYTQRSPIAPCLNGSNTEFVALFDTAVPRHFGDRQGEAAAVSTLAMADVSWLPKWGIKGPGAADFLRKKGFTPPAQLYEVDASGFLAHTGTTEYFLEDTLDSHWTATMPTNPDACATWTPVLRQDAGFWLGGKRVFDVMAQTCGLPLHRMTDEIIFTRVAGVSAMLYVSEAPARLRLWCAPSYGIYLWEILREIAGELGGRVVGLEAIRKLL